MGKAEYIKRLKYLIILAILIFFGFNGNIPPMGLDESMYMTASGEMLSSGNYVIPTYNEEPFYDKPPLVYWLQAFGADISDFFLGKHRITDSNVFIPFDSRIFGMRMSASLFAVIFLLFICKMSKKLFSAKAGIYAGYVFTLSLLTVALAKMAIIDMILSFFVFMSLMLFILIFTNRLKKPYIIISFLFLGLAVLTKGPIALGLVGIPVLTFLIFRKNIRFMFDKYTAIGFLVFLLVAVPWFLLAQKISGGIFFYEFFVHQNLQRALGQDFSHNYTPFFYVGIVLVGMAPWSWYLVPAIVKNLKRSKSNGLIVEQFLCFWIISVFLLFTLISSRLPGYIFPIFAPMAIIIGKYLAEFKFNKTTKAITYISAGFSMLLGLIFAAAPNLLTFQSIWVKLILGLTGVYLIFFSIMAVVKYNKKINPTDCFAMSMAGFLALVIIALPVFALNHQTLKDEMDTGSDFLGTTGYILGRDFGLRELSSDIIIYKMHPYEMNFPFLYEKKIYVADTKEELRKLLTEHEYYFFITNIKSFEEDNLGKFKGVSVIDEKYQGNKNGLFIDYKFRY